MTPLAREKAAAKFKITGKFTGGVGSSGKWTPAVGGGFGNDWEAEARYRRDDAPVPTMTERLEVAAKKARLGAELPEVTVAMPGKSSLKGRIKEQAKTQVKEAVSKQTKKAKSLLSPRAEAEKSRLEGLFSGGFSHPAQAIPAIRTGAGMAGLVKQILKRSNK